MERHKNYVGFFFWPCSLSFWVAGWITNSDLGKGMSCVMLLRIKRGIKKKKKKAEPTEKWQRMRVVIHSQNNKIKRKE